MSEEEIEFKKHCDETLKSIYSKINEEEKTFLSYLVSRFNNMCERNFKALELIYEELYDKEEEYHYRVSELVITDVTDKLIKTLKGDKK